MNFLTKTQLLLLELLVCVIVLVGAGMFFVAGTEAVELFRRLGQLMELEIEIPIWWMYLAFPVGFAILISFVLEMILEKSTELYQLSKSSK
jgi:TRAP-type C4-dicarboxylate transport system permease small subunit